MSVEQGLSSRFRALAVSLITVMLFQNCGQAGGPNLKGVGQDGSTTFASVEGLNQVAEDKVVSGDMVLDIQPSDPDDYRAMNPDLQNLGGPNLNQHWMQFGMKEGRSASTYFSVRDYLMLYADLRAAFGNDYSAAISHYLKFGYKEGRTGRMAFMPEIFDYATYRVANSDLKNMSGAQLRRHWIVYGIREGRVASQTFNLKYYLANNPDVKAFVAGSNAKAIEHYVLYGKKEGRKAAP